MFLAITALLTGLGVAAPDRMEVALSGEGASPKTRPATSIHCSAKRAVKFYSRRISYWHDKMGAARLGSARDVPKATCPRYLAHVLQRKAYGLRKTYGRWHEYHYNWESWLPRNWYELGRCETGWGGDPNWEHVNSRFVSAFGISWAEYNKDAAHMGAPPWHVRHTPRDQYKAALGHYDRFGDGWTCAGP